MSGAGGSKTLLDVDLNSVVVVIIEQVSRQCGDQNDQEDDQAGQSALVFAKAMPNIAQLAPLLILLKIIEIAIRNSTHAFFPPDLYCAMMRGSIKA